MCFPNRGADRKFFVAVRSATCHKIHRLEYQKIAVIASDIQNLRAYNSLQRKTVERYKSEFLFSTFFKKYFR